jgi:probable rRNA maturation factor
MPVLVQNHLRLVRFDRLRLVRLVERMLSDVGEASAELGLTFVGDRRMRRLNSQYRQKDRTTDVLAFALREASAPCPSRFADGLLGDVVISIPQAIRQAKEGARTLDTELAALMIHGILHLCGYDHERSDTEARRMHRRERMVLRRLGKIPRLMRSNRGRERRSSRKREG